MHIQIVVSAIFWEGNRCYGETIGHCHTANGSHDITISVYTNHIREIWGHVNRTAEEEKALAEAQTEVKLRAAVEALANGSTVRYMFPTRMIGEREVRWLSGLAANEGVEELWEPPRNTT